VPWLFVNQDSFLSFHSLEKMAIKSVAIIGLGPSGAITIDALVQEQTFDRIVVFERKRAPGGCW
jgi:cation diffusion facilitator CzcD-associated flavoprotein CzcO